jgi:hypothetical protein
MRVNEMKVNSRQKQIPLSVIDGCVGFNTEYKPNIYLDRERGEAKDSKMLIL